MLELDDTFLVIVDVQEAFRAAIPDLALIAERISIMARGAELLEIPIIVTEQYPKGLGPTIEEIRLSLSESTVRIEKSTFGAMVDPGFAKALDDLGRSQMLVAGVETHICVYQTVCGAIDAGFGVQFLADCVASRNERDKKTGIDRMTGYGAKASTVEMALFELLRDSKHPKFREIQGLIK